MRLKKQDKALVVFVLAIICAVVALAVALVLSMSVDALRGWAIVSILILPGGIFAGWRLGTRDSRAHMSGLDKGVNAVMRAAGRTADLRTTTAARARQVVAPVMSETLRLPDPRIVHIRAVNDEMVDL